MLIFHGEKVDTIIQIEYFLFNKNFYLINLCIHKCCLSNNNNINSNNNTTTTTTRSAIGVVIQFDDLAQKEIMMGISRGREGRKQPSITGNNSYLMITPTTPVRTATTPAATTTTMNE